MITADAASPACPCRCRGTRHRAHARMQSIERNGGTMCPGADCRSCHSWTVCGRCSRTPQTQSLGVSARRPRARRTRPLVLAGDQPRRKLLHVPVSRLPDPCRSARRIVVRTMPITASRGGCNGCHTLPRAPERAAGSTRVDRRSLPALHHAGHAVPSALWIRQCSPNRRRARPVRSSRFHKGHRGSMCREPCPGSVATRALRIVEVVNSPLASHEHVHRRHCEPLSVSHRSHDCRSWQRTTAAGSSATALASERANALDR